MLRLEDVVILMRDSKAIKYIFGNARNIEEMIVSGAIQPFNQETVRFLDDISKKLLKNSKNRLYSDIITFAFWIRKASVMQMKQRYDLSNRLGRGISFHIAPSNVPINFAYSLVTALLAGNSCIVRLSSKNFEQTQIIVDAFNFSNNFFITKRIVLLQYSHNKDITDYFSKICDSRIVWGGDRTINTIRESQIKPRALDVAFADRFSISLINSDMVIAENSIEDLARGFYNDTFLNDQNACTSPKLVVWVGNYIELAKSKFWKSVWKYTKHNYILPPAKSIEKLLKFQIMASIKDDVKLFKEDDNLIYRIQLNSLNKSIIDDFGTCGYFLEYNATDILDVFSIFESGCQTLSYFGFKKQDLIRLIIENKPSGVDRIVPIGNTLDFNIVWDGYDLIYTLSRVIGVN